MILAPRTSPQYTKDPTDTQSRQSWATLKKFTLSTPDTGQQSVKAQGRGGAGRAVCSFVFTCHSCDTQTSFKKEPRMERCGWAHGRAAALGEARVPAECGV